MPTKTKGFFWLLLKDTLNMRGLLRRRNMYLESYTCENCILQLEETLPHLFLRCNFAKNCWNAIGVISPRTTCPQRAVYRIKMQLDVPFRMEIVILMSWSIWKCRNGWLFDNRNPPVKACVDGLKQELLCLVHRAPSYKSAIEEWITSF